jgi:ABC-type sulfate/molybdate transport systems ATPase subunit
MSGDVLVRVENVTRRYDTLVAVDGLDLDVRRGEMFGLIGPDGAGKTTTLRMILGLLAPDAGRLVTCGLDPRRERRTLSGHVGYLSQRFSLYGDLSVDENIAFFAEIHGVTGWEPRREELLEMVRMTPFRTRLADRLSGRPRLAPRLLAPAGAAAAGRPDDPRHDPLPRRGGALHPRDPARKRTPARHRYARRAARGRGPRPRRGHRAAAS